MNLQPVAKGKKFNTMVIHIFLWTAKENQLCAQFLTRFLKIK